MIDGAVEFGEWLPDRSALGNPGLLEARNVIPVDGDYKPYRPLSAFTNALGLRPRGAIATLDASGNTFAYVGTATKLYAQDGVTWDDHSGAVTFTTSSEGYWRFTQFEDLVIATNYTDVPQCLPAGDAGDFEDLATSGDAPNARQIGVIGRFLFLGDTEDGVNGIVPHRVAWSAIDDVRTWEIPNTAAAQTVQSGEQFMNAAYGAVTGIFGGDQRGIVFQRGAITRLTYVGGNVVFQFDTIDATRGARYPNACVQDGDLVYFIGADGFYVTDGVSVQAIGDGKFDKHFADTVDTTAPHRVYGALDKVRGLIYWIYPGPANNAGRPNRVLVYNVSEKRAARALDDIEMVFSGLTSGISLENLDAYSGSIDALQPSLDSPFWQGGNDAILGFDATFRMGSFAGDPGVAIIESAEQELNPGGFAFVSGVKPMVASDTVTVALGTRNNLKNDVVYTAEKGFNPRTTFHDFRKEARYIRARISITGDFPFAQALEYLAIEAGS